MSKITDFYLQDGTDSEGRTLKEVLNWSNHAWESAHDSIQTMFPLKDPSNFNPDAPIITDEDVAKWNEGTLDGALLRNNLCLSYMRFLKFLGLEVGPAATREEQEMGVDKGIQVKIADNFSERQKTVWDSFNHNFLRITRCLASLRMLGLQAEADAFYKRLQALYESKCFPISEKTFKFWTEAVTGQSFTSTLGG